MYIYHVCINYEYTYEGFKRDLVRLKLKLHPGIQLAATGEMRGCVEDNLLLQPSTHEIRSKRLCRFKVWASTHLHGSFQNLQAIIQNPNSKALIRRAPAKRIPQFGRHRIESRCSRLLRELTQLIDWPYSLPRGSNVSKHWVCRASTFGIILMVLSRYLVFGYLDP